MRFLINELDHTVYLIHSLLILVLLHDQNHNLLLENLEVLGIAYEVVIVDGLIIKPQNGHQRLELLCLTLLPLRAHLPGNDLHQIIAQLVSLTTALLPNPVVLSYAFFVFFLEVIDGPAILLGIVVAVPAHGRCDQFCVETRVRPVYNYSCLFSTSLPQFDVELLAIWVVWLCGP